MIPTKVKKLMQKLLDNKFDAYIIGGAVRDTLLGIEPHDWDLNTNGTGEQILKLFPSGVVIGNEERQKRILTVIFDDVEISQYRKNGDRTETGKRLIDHQWTCDFYMNALAMDIDEKLCGDLTIKRCGQEDIENKVLRFVGNPLDRIKEDPLRILRGIRFWTKYPIRFEDIQVVLDNIDLLDTLPKERIRDEFMKIISYPNGIENLWCDGIIYKIIPELKDVVDMKGGDYHDENVNRHMENAFKEACKVTDNTLLRLACFLHDIGKGVTQTFENKVIMSGKCNLNIVGESIIEQTHFYEHENKGEEMMIKRLGILKFSSDDIFYVIKLIRLHMYSYKAMPSKKSYIRFFNKLDEAKIPIGDFIILIYCDYQANIAKPRIKFGDFVKGNWLLNKYYEIKYSEEPMTVKDLKVSGKDVIEILKIKPGPKVGEKLNEMFELVMDGELKNCRADLLNKLKECKNV